MSPWSEQEGLVFRVGPSTLRIPPEEHRSHPTKMEVHREPLEDDARVFWEEVVILDLDHRKFDLEE